MWKVFLKGKKNIQCPNTDILCPIQKKQLPLIQSNKKYYPGKRFLAIQWKLSAGHQGENASKMWNKGTQIDDTNTNDVPFDGLEPPDGFENHRWLLVRLCQLRHTLICHILEKSPEMLGKKHPKFSIKHICSMHPEKLALRFGKNKFLTSKTK